MTMSFIFLIVLIEKHKIIKKKKLNGKLFVAFILGSSVVGTVNVYFM